MTAPAPARSSTASADSDVPDPFFLAVEKNDLKTVQSMLANNPSLVAKAHKGLSALCIACKHRGSLELCAALIKTGADASFRSFPHGDSPLLLCCQQNLIQHAEMMLAHGADVNAADAFGWTPLMVACNKNFPEMVSVLLATGARCNTANKNGDRALTWACQKHLRLVELLVGTGSYLVSVCIHDPFVAPTVHFWR